MIVAWKAPRKLIWGSERVSVPVLVPRVNKRGSGSARAVLTVALRSPPPAAFPRPAQLGRRARARVPAGDYLRPELGLFTSRDPWPGDVRQPGTPTATGTSAAIPCATPIPRPRPRGLAAGAERVRPRAGQQWGYNNAWLQPIQQQALAPQDDESEPMLTAGWRAMRLAWARHLYMFEGGQLIVKGGAFCAVTAGGGCLVGGGAVVATGVVVATNGVCVAGTAIGAQTALTNNWMMAKGSGQHSTEPNSALFGARGPKGSKSGIWSRAGVGRIDVENWNPGFGEASLHFQSGGSKWKYNPTLRAFEPYKAGPTVPRWLLDLLHSDKDFQAGINKALYYLGENTQW